MRTLGYHTLRCCREAEGLGHPEHVLERTLSRPRDNFSSTNPGWGSQRLRHPNLTTKIVQESTTPTTPPWYKLLVTEVVSISDMLRKRFTFKKKKKNEIGKTFTQRTW